MSYSYTFNHARSKKELYFPIVTAKQAVDFQQYVKDFIEWMDSEPGIGTKHGWKQTEESLVAFYHMLEDSDAWALAKIAVPEIDEIDEMETMDPSDLEYDAMEHLLFRYKKWPSESTYREPLSKKEAVLLFHLQDRLRMLPDGVDVASGETKD